MTIALTLVASWGGPSDNSYIGLSEANSIAGVYLFDPSPWTALTDAQKTAALINATRAIDAGNWKGDRLYYNQNLEFPRTDDTGAVFPWSTPYTAINTFNIFQTQMKDDVQLATVIQAVYVARLPSGRDSHAEKQAAGIASYSESVRQLSESYTYSGRTSLGLASETQQILSQYRQVGRAVYRA